MRLLEADAADALLRLGHATLLMGLQQPVIQQYTSIKNDENVQQVKLERLQ
jgi:hypothetical protein